jgi:hypothetical protein
MRNLALLLRPEILLRHRMLILDWRPRHFALCWRRIPRSRSRLPALG